MPLNNPYALEVCVQTPDAVDACVGVADRIELCAGLDVGGLTPSTGLMEHAKASGVQTHVLIRPRCGDFEMTAADIAVAVADIRTVQAIGLKGVVIGAERENGLDKAALDAMVRAADGLDITLHRVIDVLDDPVAAMEAAIDYGFTRILTSGGGVSAQNGIAGLNVLHERAKGRIDVMAGAGVNSSNLAELIDQTDIRSFHASCSRKTSLSPRYGEFGFGETVRGFDRAEMKALVSYLEDAGRLRHDADADLTAP